MINRISDRVMLVSLFAHITVHLGVVMAKPSEPKPLKKAGPRHYFYLIGGDWP